MNVFAGVLNVLAEAVGRVAADPDKSQDGSDEKQNNDASNEDIHMFVWIAVAYVVFGLAYGEPPWQ